MAIKLYKKPGLEKPDMLVAWPGIGNVGIIAIDTLRAVLEAEEFGEIEPWDFFYPRAVLIKNGELEDLEFPGNKFYFKKTPQKDLIMPLPPWPIPYLPSCLTDSWAPCYHFLVPTAQANTEHR